MLKSIEELNELLQTEIIPFVESLEPAKPIREPPRRGDLID